MKFSKSTPENCVRVVITWRDIRDVSSWSEEDDVRCCRKIQTTGWLLYEGPDPAEPVYDILVIAASYDYEDERWADFTVFPTTVIKRIERGC